MFSIAKFLDSVKAKSKIETDYRLAKLIEITPQAISAYRKGKTLPGIARLETIGDFGAANGPAWHVR